MGTYTTKVLLSLALTTLVFGGQSPVQGQCAPICDPSSSLHSICFDAFKNRSDIPMPLTFNPQTLYYDNVPIPPDAIKGIRSQHAVFGANYGFRFQGAFYSSGIGTASNFSHGAVFWHDRADYLGYEYGLVSDLRNGRILFYVCGDCNTSSQRWAQGLVVAAHLNGVPMVHDVQVTSSGNFRITSVRQSNGQLVADVTFARPWWLPNLFGVGGYVTGVFQAKVNKAVFYNSYLDINSLQVYSDQCQ